MKNTDPVEELYPEYVVRLPAHARSSVLKTSKRMYIRYSIEVVGFCVLLVFVSFLFGQVSRTAEDATAQYRSDAVVTDLAQEDVQEAMEMSVVTASEQVSAVNAGVEEGVVADGVSVEDARPDTQDVSMSHETLLQAVPRPATSALAYQVEDVFSGEVFVTQNDTKVLPIASITKLVTALVAEEEIGLETRLFFVPDGQYYRVSDLLRPLFLRSNNTVAENIALYLGEARFVEHMNAYVSLLGMHNTRFGDASGLSPKNVSTTRDLAVLAKHMLQEKKHILDISKEPEATIASMAGKEWRIESHNKLAGDPYFLGGKLGFTDEARQTAVSLFSVPVDGAVRTISIVVLGSYDWRQDTRVLLRWVLQHALVDGRDGAGDEHATDDAVL